MITPRIVDEKASWLSGSHGQIDQTQAHLVGDINVCMCIMIDVM